MIIFKLFLACCAGPVVPAYRALMCVAVYQALFQPLNPRLRNLWEPNEHRSCPRTA